MNLKGPWKIVDSNKTQILLTAQKLFSEKGYRNTSIRDIADRVGTNCSMINYHFKTKENLYIQIIENLWSSLDHISSDNETDANVLLKDFVFKSIEAAFHNAQPIQLCLENKIFPVSEKTDSIIKKMTEKHFSHFKILAEKAKYSHIKFLYTSIFALTIDIVSQIAKSADSSKDSRDGLEELLRYVETTFLVQ
ncbi:TetR/AcrR family transcriptional regulator [Chryseobacterium terrae]|uniref:TetR/AcrR family transcriptional regulator n=1 Tax=Chryseobacterium terrae TaxID=3163299 RepID=A0ABW8Y1B9_9FLAO